MDDESFILNHLFGNLPDLIWFPLLEEENGSCFLFSLSEWFKQSSRRICSLQACKKCGKSTDVCCVVCEKWFCSTHSKFCEQCSRMVCFRCSISDLCCTMRNTTTESFYGCEIVELSKKMLLKLHEQTHDQCKKLRADVLSRSIMWMIERNQDSYSLELFLAQAFPSVAKLLEREKWRSIIKIWLQGLCLRQPMFLALVLVFSSERTQLFSLVQDSILVNAKALKTLQAASWSYDKWDLFDLLKEKNLLDPVFAQQSTSIMKHEHAMKWMEEVVTGKRMENLGKQLSNLYGNVEFFEFLVREKRITVEYVLKKLETFTSFSIDALRLKILLKYEGIESVARIPQRNIFFSVDCVRTLKRYNYHFDKTAVFAKKRTNDEIYALFCYGGFLWEDFDAANQKILKIHSLIREVKICDLMLPFLKPIRKKKIITFIMCVNHIYGRNTPKEIIWTILDYCFSPKKEV